MFGSIFYSKTMLKIYGHDKELKEKIEKIHSVIYNYSAKLIEELLSNDSFRFLVDFFNTIHKARKDSVMNKITHNDRKFEYGLDFLMCLLNRREIN